jgi:putative transposase
MRVRHFATYWVMVVMDQFTRRIVGFGVHAGIIDGMALCRILHNEPSTGSMPKSLSPDDHPLYRSHRRQAYLRALGVTEIKTVPYVPLFHPWWSA